MIQIFIEVQNLGAEMDFKDWIVQSTVWCLIESLSYGLASGYLHYQGVSLPMEEI